MTEVFCKKIVNIIMPAVRAIIAKRLLEEGLTQMKVAELLDVTQPSIANYKKGLRGKIVSRMLANPEFIGEINQLTEKVKKGEDLVNYTCEICEKTRTLHVMKKNEIEPFICAKEL